ncbi:GNAT family N-acetyltransferase [Streptomyces sp. NPDC006259]|uniref:GNAT family N-acetyltransferase n=1 Tax=Streptomyces sp. NPDC006259 TaxID=3364740 RepID=UPI00367CEA42
MEIPLGRHEYVRMLRVERAVCEDWTALKQLRLRALEADADAFGSTLADERARPEAFWLQRILVSAWFLAWSAEQAVGVAALVTASGTLTEERQLDAMWVASAWRGRGVGEALISAAIGHASAHGATSVSLTVADGNERARALYQRMGFRPTGERSPRPRDPHQMRERFRLTLPDPGPV